MKMLSGVGLILLAASSQIVEVTAIADPLLVKVLPVTGIPVSATTTPAPVCSSKQYASFLPLSPYSTVKYLCSFKFPVSAPTTTVTASPVHLTRTVTTVSPLTTITTITEQSVVSTEVIQETPPSVTSVETIFLTDVGLASTTTASVTLLQLPKRAAANAVHILQLYSRLLAKPSAFVSTYCSCIEKPHTKTKTKTVTPTIRVHATATNLQTTAEVTIQGVTTTTTTTLQDVPNTTGDASNPAKNAPAIAPTTTENASTTTAETSTTSQYYRDRTPTTYTNHFLS